MMEPHIQYAQNTDGVSIAYWTLGEGMPFVYMPTTAFSHIQLEWQWPEYRQWYERLAEKRRVIRYDGRGTGLSERNVIDFSLGAHVLDLEAVVDSLNLKRFALFGGFTFGPVAIAYAARHPERVSHLFLWCSWARASDAYRSPQAQSIVALRDKDWKTYTETVAHVLLGWSAGRQARRFAEFMRECNTQEATQAALAAATEFDVTALLPEVKVPTLVLYRRQAPIPDVNVAKALTSRITHARLVLLEGTSLAPYLGGTELVVSAINEFLGKGKKAAARREPMPAGGLVTIFFTDMEGSTTLTQRLGDARAQEVLRIHNSIVRKALKAHGGTEIKHTGDGIMASLTSASRALDCAIAIQRDFAQHNESNLAIPIRVRIGLNAGEPVVEDQDLFGTAVQLAARICAHAEPGQVLVPIVVRELAAGKRFLFDDRGTVALRGFEERVRLYEVRWREEE